MPALVAACPNITTFRSSRVLSSNFTDTELTGFWYVQAYKDPAQVGASCQTMNSTRARGGSGVISMDFSVRYGPIPFTIVEVYTPTTDKTPGLYTKNVKEPGGQFVNLATVVVDVMKDTCGLPPAPRDPSAGRARLAARRARAHPRSRPPPLHLAATRRAAPLRPRRSMVLYSCLDLGVTHVDELVVVTRAAKPPDALVTSQVALAQQLGVPVATGDVRRVVRDGCSA